MAELIRLIVGKYCFGFHVSSASIIFCLKNLKRAIHTFGILKKKDFEIGSYYLSVFLYCFVGSFRMFLSRFLIAIVNHIIGISDVGCLFKF